MRLSRLIFVLLLVAARLPAWAASSSADAPHVHVELLVPASNLYHGDQLNDAGLYFKLEPGWHVYWMNPGDAGEPPRIQWTLPAGVTAGPMQFPAPMRLPLGPLMDFGYENEVLFPLKLHVADSVNSGPATLHAKVSWLVCQATCIPGKAELALTRTVAATAAPAAANPLIAKYRALLPKPLPATDKAIFEANAAGFRLQVETGRQEKSALFFPADPDLIDNPAPQLLTVAPTHFILNLKKSPYYTTAPTVLNGVIELSGGRNYVIAAKPGAITAAFAAPVPASAAPPVAPSSVPAPPRSFGTASMQHLGPSGSFLGSTLLAFLGGLLLNLMPCVFPVLFLKGLALVNSGNQERHKLRAHGFLYAAGIVVSFWVLVAVLLGLRAAGSTLGWGFQFQSPVFLALMAGLLFFLGLSLAGQFEIGLTLTSAGGSLAAKHGYTGSFFTGVLAVVVATPCTAPFMGAAIGYALSASAAVTFAVFTALALGLAAPYVALTLQPAWTRILPKPGAWMEVLRQAISVPIFLTVIWLAWVMAQAYGAGVLAALLVSFLLLAIAGWFLGRWPAKRWATVVAALIVLGVVGLSIFASRKMVTASETLSPPETQGAWQPWSQAAVDQALAQGRPVFVDFTAKWCLSCQVNERVALAQPEVRKAFAEANVVLLRADWTQHDDAITQALTALNRSGVPAYALYAPGQTSPQMLPEVLTPGIVTDALAKLPKPAMQAITAAPNPQ
ncbi:MAG: thioredoxin family protein [Terracidiphilus sp.]